MNRAVQVLAGLLFMSVSVLAQSPTITTYVGPPLPSDGDSASLQVIGMPNSIIPDGAGGFYFTSSDQNRLYRVAATGVMTVAAGSPYGLDGYSGDGGPANAAQLAGPAGVARDAAGNFYIADTLNHRIRKVSTNGVITTIAGTGTQGFKGDGTPGTSAQLNSPSGVAVDAAGNVYIADQLNNRIRKVAPDGTIDTIAGNGRSTYAGDGGPATVASLSQPVGLALDAAGNLYIADELNNRVRKVTPDGIITTIAGGGPQNADGVAATAVSLTQPAGIAFDAYENLYIVEYGSHRVRKVTADGVINTLAGNGLEGYSGDGGVASLARLDFPSGIAVDDAGNVFVADSFNSRIRRITALNLITTVAGRNPAGSSGDQGPATAALLNSPASIALDRSGNLYVSDWKNQVIRKVTPAGLITTIACCGSGVVSGYSHPWGVAVDDGGNIYVADTRKGQVIKLPAGLTCADRTARSICSGKDIVNVAGSGTPGFSGDGGPATAAQLNSPNGIALDTAGNLYIADSFNNRIRKITPGGVIVTIAGQGSPGYSGEGVPATAAQLFRPSSVAVDSAGNIYIADTGNYRVRKVTPDGIIHTIAGSSRPQSTSAVGDGEPATTPAVQLDPVDVVADVSGNIYIADRLHHRIRKVGTDGIIRTIAGTGDAGFAGDGSLPNFAHLNMPAALAMNAIGDIYISDSGNDRIRRIANESLFSVSALGNVSLTTVASVSALSGSARIETAPGGSAPSGLAILDSRHGDVLVSEVALPAVSPITNGRVYFELREPLTTAVAIANPNNQDVQIKFHFDGVNINSDREMTLAANGQLSAFLDQSPFNILPPEIGTLTFTSSLPIATLVLRSFRNERGDLLFTPLPVANMSAGFLTDPVTLPLFADGGGWSTEIVLANLRNSPISGTIQFLDQRGKPTLMTVGDQVSDTFSYSLDPNGAAKLTTSGSQLASQAGSIRLIPAAQSFTPLAASIITLKNDAATLSQAIATANISPTFQVFTEISGDFDHASPGSIQMAISISNLSNLAGKLAMDLIQSDGSSTSLTANVDLPASGQVLEFLSQIPGLNSVTLPFRGILRIRTTLPIAVAALRVHYNERGELLFTTIPDLNDFSPPSGAIVFPHFAQGGGFTTQFVLLNASTVQGSSGALRLISQSGQALAVPVK